jgi:hypothetical protein
MNRDRRNQRGVALAYIAIFMVVILGFTVLGIDVARLAFTASEVQAVADTAARGGAVALFSSTATNGDGITRAKFIGGENFMNGAHAPKADVVVDEGFWDGTNNKFECCGANNTPCCANRASAPWSGICQTSTRDCTAKHAAVLAMPKTEVTNLLAGVFDGIVDGHIADASQGTDNKHTTVEKMAIAAAVGPAEGCKAPAGCSTGDWKCYCEHGVAPCLPIAAPSCKYDCSASTCTLPSLQVSSANSDSAAWTTFDANNAPTSKIRDYLNANTAATGCKRCDSKQGEQVQPQQTGGDLRLTNGSNGSGNGGPFELAKCLIGQGDPDAGGKKCTTPPTPQGCTFDSTTGKINGYGGSVFTIPIFDLSPCTTQMNQTKPLAGFATVNITSVTIAGSSKQINLQTLNNTSDTGAPTGGECFRTDCSVALMR